MDLDLYTKKINEEHAKCQDAAKDMFQHGMEAGRLLLEVKEALPHGHFGKWLEENFDGSRSVAAKYMGCFRAVNTGMVPMPEGNTSLERVLKAMREQNAELEPEEPAAPREPAPPASEADYEEEVEGEEYDFGDEEEDGAAQGGAAQEPAPKKSRSRRDMKSTALTKVDEWIREVPGKERDRIRELRNYLDVYEEALNAKDAPPQRGPRDNGADVGKSALRGRSVGGPKDVVARLAPEMMEKAS
jgi:hypothetical protein